MEMSFSTLPHAHPHPCTPTPCSPPCTPIPCSPLHPVLTQRTLGHFVSSVFQGTWIPH